MEISIVKSAYFCSHFPENDTSYLKYFYSCICSPQVTFPLEPDPTATTVACNTFPWDFSGSIMPPLVTVSAALLSTKTRSKSGRNFLNACPACREKNVLLKTRRASASVSSQSTSVFQNTHTQGTHLNVPPFAPSLIFPTLCVRWGVVVAPLAHATWLTLINSKVIFLKFFWKSQGHSLRLEPCSFS